MASTTLDWRRGAIAGLIACLSQSVSWGDEPEELRPISLFARVEEVSGTSGAGPEVGSLTADPKEFNLWEADGTGVRRAREWEQSPLNTARYRNFLERKVRRPDTDLRVIVRQVLFTEFGVPPNSPDPQFTLRPEPLFFGVHTVEKVTSSGKIQRDNYIACVYPETTKTAILEHRFPLGAWENLSGPESFLEQPVSLMSRQEGADVHVTVDGNCDHSSLRLIGRARDGTRHHPAGLVVQHKAGRSTTTFRFRELSLEDAGDFQLQYRPIHCYRKRLSLWAGRKIDSDVPFDWEQNAADHLDFEAAGLVPPRDAAPVKPPNEADEDPTDD